VRGRRAGACRTAFAWHRLANGLNCRIMVGPVAANSAPGRIPRRGACPWPATNLRNVARVSPIPYHSASFVLLFQQANRFFRVAVMKTFSAKPETVKRDWYVVDASGKTL